MVQRLRAVTVFAICLSVPLPALAQGTTSRVSGTVADACAACHEKYRDTADTKDRCTP